MRLDDDVKNKRAKYTAYYVHALYRHVYNMYIVYVPTHRVRRFSIVTRRILYSLFMCKNCHLVIAFCLMMDSSRFSYII